MPGHPGPTAPFVTVNSGSLPPDLLESNLFGHLKGAFTGAVAAKKGLFELADKGTIFFDEIGSVPVETQAKLLRGDAGTGVHAAGRRRDEEGRCAYHRRHEHRPPSARGGREVPRGTSIIGSTSSRSSCRRFANGARTFPCSPSIFLEKYGVENDKRNLELTAEALDFMEAYDWPGNVRELENVIERAVVLATGSRIDPDLIPDAVRTQRPFQMPQFVMPPEGLSLKDVVAAFESQLIERTLAATGGVQKRAAEMLQVKPTTLNEMIKRYDILPRRKRGLAPGSGGAGGTADPETPRT